MRITVILYTRHTFTYLERSNLKDFLQNGFPKQLTFEQLLSIGFLNLSLVI